MAYEPIATDGKVLIDKKIYEELKAHYFKSIVLEDIASRFLANKPARVKQSPPTKFSHVWKRNMDTKGFNIRFTKRVDEQIDKIYDYLADNLSSPKAGDNFFANIDKSIKYIERDPFIYPSAKGQNFRKCIIGNYVMFYEINETAKTITILSMYHGSQNYGNPF